jgi:hypothetical protein
MSTANSQGLGEACRSKAVYDDQSLSQIAWIKNYYLPDEDREDTRLEQRRTELENSIAAQPPALARQDSVFDPAPRTAIPNETRKTAVTDRLTVLRRGVFDRITRSHEGCEQGCPKNKPDPQSHLSTTQGSVVSGPSTASARGEADSNV